MLINEEEAVVFGIDDQMICSECKDDFDAKDMANAVPMTEDVFDNGDIVICDSCKQIILRK